jgi:hypothetical protein
MNGFLIHIALVINPVFGQSSEEPDRQDEARQSRLSVALRTFASPALTLLAFGWEVGFEVPPPPVTWG